MQTLQPEISISYNIITTFSSEQSSQANGKEKDFAKNKTKQETRILAVDPFYRCYFFFPPRALRLHCINVQFCIKCIEIYIVMFVCIITYACIRISLYVRVRNVTAGWNLRNAIIINSKKS